MRLRALAGTALSVCNIGEFMVDMVAKRYRKNQAIYPPKNETLYVKRRGQLINRAFFCLVFSRSTRSVINRAVLFFIVALLSGNISMVIIRALSCPGQYKIVENT